MLGQLTAQFAIVRVPEHRSLPQPAARAADLGARHLDGVLRRPDRALQPDELRLVGQHPALLRARAGGDPRRRGRAADRPLAAPADDGPVRSRRRAHLRRTALRPLPGRDLRDLGDGRLLRCVLPPRLLLGHPQPRSRGLSRRGERPHAGRREPRHADGARSGRGRCRAARLEHRVRPQLGQLPRLGPAPRAHRQPAAVAGSGPDRTHPLARGSRGPLPRSPRPAPLVDRPHLELGDARVHGHQRGGDRAHDGRLRGGQCRVRRVRRLLGRRHRDRQRRRRVVHRAAVGVRRLSSLVPRHRGRRGDLRRQPGPRARLCRRRHLRGRATASASSAT